MPFNPQQVGAKLTAVGNKQIDTGKKLELYSAKVKNTGIVFRDDETIDESLDAIEAGTRSVRSLLGPVATAFHSIANLFEAITVPTIDFTRATFDIPVIGRQRFVTGITLGTTKPFRTIATNLENVADDINAIREALRAVADGVNRVQGQLPAMADNLITGSDDIKLAGMNLIEGGKAMVEAGTLLSAP